MSILLGNRKALKDKLDGLADDYATGLLTREMLARAKGTAEAELQRTEDAITALNRQSLRVNVPVGQTLPRCLGQRRERHLAPKPHRAGRQEDRSAADSEPDKSLVRDRRPEIQIQS